MALLPDLTQYLWIVWIVLALVFVIIELLTLEFTFLMLAAGTLIGGLGVNLLGGPWWLQIAAAAALSGLLLFTIRPLLLKTLHRGEKPVPMNVDALFGMLGRVVAPVDAVSGSVRLDNGETWTAKTADGHDGSLDVGARVKVTTVLGATVEVAPAPLRSTPQTEETDS